MTTRPRAQRIKAKAGYHHGDLGRQLVVAARRLVDRHGAHGFKLSDAAALAGVSTAAPYRHFKDRDALLSAVTDDGFERLALRLAEAADACSSGSQEAICAIGDAYIGFAQANPNVFRLMFAPHAAEWQVTAEEGLSPAGVAAYEVLVRQVAENLQLGIEAPPVLGTAVSLWMFVHGFALLLIDEHLGVGQLEIDTAAMVRANTRQMLRAFVA